MAQAPRPQDRRVPPPGETVELRVHGVGGATPEEMLDVPLTELVAGDEGAGFFRPWRPESSARALEGYSWGGLTSASRVRAMWVLLTPFALANLAGWMLRHDGEPTDEGRRRRRLLEGAAVALVRVFGVVLTVAVVAYLAVAGIDLIGFQCGARPTCAGGRWWLSPWESGLVAGDAGKAVVVGALVPVAAALGLAWLARRSQIAIHRARRDRFDETPDPALQVNLHHPELWDSPHVAHRLGLTHTAAGLAAVGVTVASISDHASGSGIGALTVAGWALLVLAAVAAVRLEGVSSRLHLGLLAVAGVHLVATLSVMWAGGGLDPVSGPLPGGRVVAGVLLPVYPVVALAAALTAVAVWRRNRHGQLRVALASSALLLVAAGVVNAVGSGLLIRLADLLGTPVVASDYPVSEPMSQPPIVYADAVADAAVVTVYALVVTLVVAGFFWFRAGRGPDCAELAVRYAERGGLECDRADDRAWAREVGRAEMVARLTDRVAVVLATVTLIVVVSVAIAALFASDEAGLELGAWVDPLARPASVVVGAIPLLAVVGISRLYRSRRLRRVAGIVWDVSTFWPRWFHPWSPPSYGERAVPQLGYRLALLAERGRVVLSAHSQGSVMGIATLARADSAVAARVALLTHGSPLTRLYARYFPEYCSPEMYGAMADRLAGWVNLWRVTDFIGGPVAAPGVEDREVFDPPSTQAPAPGEPRPRPFRHSDYDRTDEYRHALEELSGRLPGG